MLFLAPMYDEDAKQNFEVIIVLKDKKEIDALVAITESALQSLNKRSMAYKIAQRISDHLV